MSSNRKPKVFFGWWTVLAGGFLCLWGYGYYAVGISALFKPIASELGFSRAATSVATSIGRFEGGFEAALTGWIVDRFGPKHIIVFGSLVIAVGLALMHFVHSLWAFYLVWGVIIGTGCNIALALPVDKAITNWFVSKRGLALSMRWVFQGLSTCMLPLIAWLIIMVGWRMTCVIGGVVMCLVGVPLASFLIKQQRPEYYGLLPDGATVVEKVADTSQMIDRGVEYASTVRQEVEFTLRQAMRTPAYWLLIAAYSGFSMYIQVIAVHGVPMLTDMGVEPLKAAMIIGIVGAATIPTRFIGGFLADRVKKEHMVLIVMGSLVLEVAGLVAYLLNQTVAMAYVLFILYYIGFGMGIPLNAAIRARYFGRKAFGSIQGTSTMIMTPLGALAPIYAGWVYDTSGSYIPSFIAFAWILVFCTVVILFVRPPKPPDRVTDIHKFL